MNSKNENFSSRDGAQESLWQQSNKIILNQNFGEFLPATVYDAVVVGAGITGITTALLLQRSGLSCVIVEAQLPGFGTTGGTSAHLNTFFDASYPEVESDFGKQGSKLLAQAGKEALNMIRAFVKELNIDCQLEDKSAWLYAESKQESKQLQRILEASKAVGIKVDPTNENLVPVPFDSVICFQGQGQFHPLKYISALLTEFIRLGGVLQADTVVSDSSFQNQVYSLTTAKGFIHAKNLIYATHIPPGLNSMSFKNAPYRSYVLALRLKDNNYPQGLAYDMQEPYHYYRTQEIDGEPYLIVGGQDHKTGHGDPELAFKALEDYVCQYYQVESVDYRWSSQYYVPVDGLPYIGQLPGAAKGTFMATGFNGNGMTFGTLSAQIICALILKKESPYTSLFNPSRSKPVAGFSEFVKENADVAWHFIADRFSTEQLNSLADLAAQQGKLVDFEGKKLAIYKDDQGKVTALNPTCTHAGCTVQFNAAERSWDCPCHGGRFDISGKVITGPPTIDLETVMVSYDLKP